MMPAKSHTNLRGQLLVNEPMARHTSWRVGGPADRFYIPADLDDLAAFIDLAFIDIPKRNSTQSPGLV